MAGQTNSTLVLTNLVAEQDGRYSVVVSNASLVATNFTYLAIDPTFTKITEGPIVSDLVKSWAGMFADYDGDGLLDLVVLGDHFSVGKNTRLYHNEGQGQFRAVTDSPWDSLTDRIMYSPWADPDNDGDLDLYFMGYESGPDRFLLNNGDGTFADWDGQPSSLLQVGNGMPVWGDYNNDGFLDLLITGPDHCRLFRHSGDGSFVEVTAVHPVTDPSNAQSAAWADHDNDGDLDLFVAGRGGRNYLYQNNGNGNHWLKVRLNGTASNSHGVGAKVFARTTQGLVARQMRQIQAQSVIQEMEAHFGLGSAPIVTLLRVEWPSGTIQELADVAADQILTLWEPPGLSAAVQPDGACALSIRAEPNRSWQIQSSGDLDEWQTLMTKTSGTVGSEFVDSTATGMDCRFYRVVPE